MDKRVSRFIDDETAKGLTDAGTSRLLAPPKTVDQAEKAINSPTADQFQQKCPDSPSLKVLATDRYRRNIKGNANNLFDICRRFGNRLKTTGGRLRFLQMVFSILSLILVIVILTINVRMAPILAWITIALLCGIIRACYQLIAFNYSYSCFNGDIFFAIVYALVCVTLGIALHISPPIENVLTVCFYIGIGLNAILSFMYLAVTMWEMVQSWRARAAEADEDSISTT